MIAERIKKARDVLKLSQSEAARISGIPLGTLRKYEHGPSQPGAEAIVRFTRLGINAHWLLTGTGAMLLDGQPCPVADSAQELETQGASADYVALPPCSAARDAADPGERADSGACGDALMFRKDWIRIELDAAPSDLCFIRVSGDSMEPMLRAGDVILVDTRARHPNREGVYILRMDGMLLVKRIQAMPGGTLQISSDNAAFVPWLIKLAELEQSDLTVVGRVVWSGRRL
ncbi:helix-turn-helix transcriptional regulator [Pseudothauera nasutitermitis]|uniref:Helix-turn-helix transcriptional regulator n=1 Tax=Pseudothauera nasutitermitis TaxID=2565930 RepID=A0A4S4AX67_9RHOO|nr:helix-turn-helix transcriptional regulator [Pseudothauera nasutitermitis]THF64665.1 helix-turn-helix transcriptional regulator [Pseudothauera nasutitermitis]